MANQVETKRSSGSRRERAHAAMLKAALARPGVREVMEVYRGWQEKDRGLDAYRSATKALGSFGGLTAEVVSHGQKVMGERREDFGDA